MDEFKLYSFRAVFSIVLIAFSVLVNAGQSSVFAQNDSSLFSQGQIKKKNITFSCAEDGQELTIFDNFNEKGNIKSRRIENLQSSTYFNYLVVLSDAEYEYESDFIKKIKTSPAQGAQNQGSKVIYEVIEYDDEKRPKKAVTRTVNIKDGQLNDSDKHFKSAYENWLKKGSQILHLYRYIDEDHMVVEQFVRKGPYNRNHSKRLVRIYDEKKALKSVLMENKEDGRLNEIFAVERNTMGKVQRIRNGFNENLYKYSPDGVIEYQEIYSSLGVLIVKYKYTSVEYDDCQNVKSASLEAFRFDEQMKSVMIEKEHELLFPNDKENAWGACKNINMKIVYDYASEC